MQSRAVTSLLILLLAAFALPAGASGSTVQAEQPLRIAVAANFRLTLERLVAAFTEHAASEIVVSSGASGLLYGQIVQGAPFDLFFSADAERPRRLEAAGLIVPGSRFVYAIGQLALWQPGRSLDGTVEDALRQPSARTLAIANPATAPYGLAAVQVLDRLGLAAQSPFRIVRGESLGQTFQFVASGNADLGFIALSQLIEFEALNGRSVRTEALLVDPSLHEPIVQEAVWLARARDNATAREFLKFVQGPGRTIVAEAGYLLPGLSDGSR
ncbi:MAG TPA: molybdate ABC transporter substrate-binding protein [Steroidobacteraceae bacterium]|nr:molybdate ABC transporter substrate-binding protein [Steroidobacteraceae bacterium]